MAAPVRARLHRLAAPLAIAAGAVVLRLVTGVGFANYDSLYALVWGQQLSRGETPSYGVPIAPTPHPLIEALGLVLAPLGPRTAEDVLVALGFLALAGVGWVVFRLGSEWFGWPAGALAALLVLTRVPVLSYGVRAYVDIPYLLFVLWALLVETRRSRAGAPVLALLAVAGLLRPEAWVFSALYWLWLVPGRSRGDLARLAGLALAAPALWLLSDLLVTGDALWSLTNTRSTAQALERITGLRNVPEWIPRRIGEIARPPVLVGAALGGLLSLLWLRGRARLGAAVGVVAVVVFAAFATAGLPINTRYAFLAAVVVCLFCGAGVFGWLLLPVGDPRRRWWMAGGALVLVLLVAFIPSQYRSGDGELDSLARQQADADGLTALVDSGAVGLRCGVIGVPNHRPVPLLALRLRASPVRVVSAQDQGITSGMYIAPATRKVARDFILDPHDPHPVSASVPLGFRLVRRSAEWDVFELCG
jgi:hypothetical protein